MTSEIGPVAQKIRENLDRAFAPSHLEVINESHMHNVPKGSETHFKVVVISSAFHSLPLIKRHRLVNSALSNELASGVHALSILAKTPEQWSPDEVTESSPACRGGFGK
ncbi:BolA protein [Trinorchestia longiramus]|nr:BolA protein [Trinorchestia longiramus]